MPDFAILDADGHVTESPEQVARYLDEPYRRRPLTFPIYPADGWDHQLWAPSATGGQRQSWLRALDKGGMELPVLYPTMGLFVSFVRDRAWQVALCRAYNTYLRRRSSPSPRACVQWRSCRVLDPDAAAVELRRAVRELGLSGAMLAADGDQLLGDARFDPVYEEAQRLGVMLGVHASGSHLGGAGVDLFPRFVQAHTVPIPSARCASSPRWSSRASPTLPHPEAGLPRGGGGLGAVLDGADGRRVRQARRRRGPRPAQAPERVRPRRQHLLLVRGRRWLLPQALRLVGEGQVVYASDFPHWDNSYPGSLDEIVNRGDITEAQKRKVLGNCRRLYGV